MSRVGDRHELPGEGGLRASVRSARDLVSPLDGRPPPMRTNASAGPSAEAFRAPDRCDEPDEPVGLPHCEVESTTRAGWIPHHDRPGRADADRAAPQTRRRSRCRAGQSPRRALTVAFRPSVAHCQPEGPEAFDASQPRAAGPGCRAHACPPESPNPWSSPSEASATLRTYYPSLLRAGDVPAEDVRVRVLGGLVAVDRERRRSGAGSAARRSWSRTCRRSAS